MIVWDKTLYAAIIDDHHVDLSIRLYTTKERAIQVVKDHIADEDEIEVQEIEEYCYFASYGTEGDCVWVEELEIYE